MSDIAGTTQSNPWDDVGSAGVVPARTATVGNVRLSSGEVLESVDVVYETLGTLSPAHDNVVLVCHALSGDAHVAGRRESDPEVVGWWDAFVGPGKAIDTDRYFVVASNVLGGCSGTTGPSSIDPRTDKPYGLAFPIVTIEDMVEVQARLLDSLGIERPLAVVGGSMGGMQALAWAKLYPERVASVLAIATTWRLAAQAIAFNEVGRTAILGDSAFADGAYYGGPQPKHGLAIARMIGHITYLSDESMREKFGRRLRYRDEHAFEFVTEFEVESYLAYQGKRFTERFDANTYLYMTKAMDYFDLTGQSGSLTDALRGTPARWLVLSFSSDWLFPTYQSRELVDALRCVGARVSYAEVPSPYGHDAFLLEPEQQYRYISSFLASVLAEERASATVGGAR